MADFKEFISQQPNLNLWKATKEEIIDYWKKLRTDTPIQINSIDYTHKGSTYGEDGIRITGNPIFIGTVLARLKEILPYENATTKLNVTYRETKSPTQSINGVGKTSYVFYVSVKDRGGQS